VNEYIRLIYVIVSFAKSLLMGGGFVMVSDYRRGWEDALDVALHFRDWELLKSIKRNLEARRMEMLKIGP
jgi:hypothetical protein